MRFVKSLFVTLLLVLPAHGNAAERDNSAAIKNFQYGYLELDGGNSKRAVEYNISLLKFCGGYLAVSDEILQKLARVSAPLRDDNEEITRKVVALGQEGKFGDTMGAVSPLPLVDIVHIKGISERQFCDSFEKRLGLEANRYLTKCKVDASALSYSCGD